MIYPRTVVEGVFRQSDGKMLMELLADIEKTLGPQGEPGPKGDKGDKGDTGEPGPGIDASTFYVTAGKKEGTTLGYCATSEGLSNTASGNFSHAEGADTTASGECSHAEGYMTTASGECSHVSGGGTIASAAMQTVIGLHNVEYAGNTANELNPKASY